MATNFVNIADIASEALVNLESNLVAGALMYRDKSSDFSGGAYAKGDTVTIKTRPSYETNEFSTTIVEQDIRESSASMTIDKHFDISVPWTSKDEALNLDGISEQIIQPMMVSMADKIDTHLLSKAWAGRSLYESLTLNQSAGDIALGRKVANESQVDMSGRIGIVNSSLEATMLGVDAFNRFDSRNMGGVSALEGANMGTLMGIDWNSSVNFTNSNYAAGDGTATTKTTPTGTENAVGTSTLFLQGTSVGTFEVGDRIVVAGLKRPLIVATQVTVGGASIPLSHQIDEIIPATAAITVVGSGRSDIDYQGVIMSPGAFAMASVPLEQPSGADSFVATLNGLSIRLTRQYSVQTKKTVLSADLLLGATCYDPRQVVLLGSSTA